MVVAPRPNSAERKSKASRFVSELASDPEPRSPDDLKTSLINLKPAGSKRDVAELEDIASSFVGARFCSLDDSALKTSRHYYLSRAELFNYKGAISEDV